MSKGSYTAVACAERWDCGGRVYNVKAETFAEAAKEAYAQGCVFPMSLERNDDGGRAIAYGWSPEKIKHTFGGY